MFARRDLLVSVATGHGGGQTSIGDRLGLPNVDRSISRRSGEALAIGAEGNTMNAAARPAQGRHFACGSGGTDADDLLGTR